jgi:predicted transcriptional regulator
MIVKIGKRRVDVARADCGSLACFAIGFDKGTFTQGRGYTSYHKDAKGRRVEKPVCATRHYGGCPTHSVCQRCWGSSPLEPDGLCDRPGCGGLRVEPDAERRPFVFSVQAEFVSMFRAGTKRWEYRTRRPAVTPGEYHLIYESRGSSRIVAEAKIGRVVSGTPGEVWARTGDAGGVSEAFFDEYFTWPQGSAKAGQRRVKAHAIEMELVWLEEPLPLPASMKPPQSWSRWTGRWPLPRPAGIRRNSPGLTTP